MDLNLGVFQEPRGVMRIIQFIFAICAFATLAGYGGSITYSQCEEDPTKDVSVEISYPFHIYINQTLGKNCTKLISGDFSSDAKFFVATGVLAFLYSLGITVVYVKFDELYRRDNTVPLVDFILTVFLGILWLSSSGAWANGLTGLKSVTDLTRVKAACCKLTTTPSFSSLNISVLLGFLNFFLWAADLWFLYKETAWFLGTRPPAATSGV